ncbi:hypothetical protein D3C73_1042130 [compost metagenome]
MPITVIVMTFTVSPEPYSSLVLRRSFPAVAEEPVRKRSVCPEERAALGKDGSTPSGKLGIVLDTPLL